MSQPRLSIVPIALDEANAFVAAHHRHHQPVIGHKFSLAVASETEPLYTSGPGSEIRGVVDPNELATGVRMNQRHEEGELRNG